MTDTRILDFSDFITDRTRDFTGREWVFAEIDRWLADRKGPPLFILTGGAGTGKSAITARLTQIRDVAACHFCAARDLRMIDPALFARSLSSQLCRIDGFALGILKDSNIDLKFTQNIQANYGQAINTQIENLVVNAPSGSAVFTHAVTQPLMTLCAGGYDRQVLVVVDALDEAILHRGTETILDLLAIAGALPPRVHILATTRDDPRVLKYFRGAKTFDLIKDAPPNADDVRAYAAHRLITVASALDAAAREVLARRLSTAAKGVFLYAAMILDELGLRLAQEPGLDLGALKLPDGLSGLYQDFLNRELGQDENRWYDTFKPILGLIGVAQGDGLTATQLAAISDKDVEQPLRICKQYLVGKLPEGPFRVFHKSFADFLLEDDKNLDYHVDAATMHKRIADYYQRIYSADWSQCDDYGRHHLPFHAAEAGVLQVLLTQPSFWVQVEPAALRNALETARKLPEDAQEVSSIFSLAYPDLLGEAPSTRAAVLHLAALKQAAAAVAAFFEPALVGSPWRAAWSHTVPRRIPYRQRKTGGVVRALTAAIVHGSLNVVTLEDIANRHECLLSVWTPIEDEVRTTTMPLEFGGTPSLRVLDVEAQTYIEIRAIERVILVGFEGLEQIYAGGDIPIAVWVEGDMLYTVEADLHCAIYLCPLGSPAMYRQQEKPGGESSLQRSPETVDERPIVQLDSQVRRLQPVATRSAEPVLAAVIQTGRLALLFPRQIGSRMFLSQVTLEDGTPQMKEATLQGIPVLALLYPSAVLFVDPHEDRLLERIRYRDVRILSKAYLQDVAVVKAGDATLVLIATEDDEILCWDVGGRRFTHEHVLEQLRTIDSIEFEGRSLVLTGHATSIQVWNARQLTEAAIQDPVEEVVMTTAAAIDGRPMVAVLAWVDVRKSMRLTVRDSQTGEPLYAFERPQRQFRPHFLALCRTIEGPCVVLQSDWWNDEIEFHPFLQEAEVVRVSPRSRPKLGPDGETVQVNDPWWPEQFTDVDFKVMSTSHSQDNPSSCLEAFVKQVFAGLPGLAEFWEGHPWLVVTDPIGRGLAAVDFFNRESEHETVPGLLFLREQADPAIILDVSRPDMLAATIYNGDYVAVTIDKQNGAVSKWLPEPEKVLHGNDPEVLLQLGTPIALAMGTVAGQLMLAVGHEREIIVIPLSEGPVRTNLHIAEQATAISFAAHDMLIVGTCRGVEAFRLGEGPLQASAMGPDYMRGATRLHQESPVHN